MTKLIGLGTVLLILVLPRIDHPDAASLGGRITDESLVAIRGATVSATNVFSREVETTQSDADGFYKLIGLQQGRYSVFVKTEDHGCKWVFNVFLFRGQHTQLDLTLAKSQKKVRKDGCTERVRSEK